jgi:hypothetical protein
MKGVSLVRRLTALLAALLVATYPLALERCRTACVRAAAPVESSSHACHETADTDTGPQVTSVPNACGHSDEARTADIAGLSPTKLRPELAPPIDTAVAIGPLRVLLDPIRRSTASPPDTVDTPRNLPLRL